MKGIAEITPEEARVYNAVPRGQDNAVGLEALAGELGLKPRSVRRAFESLCEKGYVVCNLRTGYFLPECADDYDTYYMMINAYCRNFKKKVHHIKAARVRDHGEPSPDNPAYPKRGQKALQQAREA